MFPASNMNKSIIWQKLTLHQSLEEHSPRSTQIRVGESKSNRYAGRRSCPALILVTWLVLTFSSFKKLY